MTGARVFFMVLYGAIALLGQPNIQPTANPPA